MSDKCIICKEKIEETFLGKKKGSAVKIKKDGKNELVYVCDVCQKNLGESVKKEAEKRA